jgi:dTMP kinase
LPDHKRRPPLAYYRTSLPGVDYSELQGKLIVIEGPDSVGLATQILRLKPWLEQLGHAVLDSGMGNSALAAKEIKKAKEGNILSPLAMTLYYVTDFADRLEHEIIPALRAGFVVLTDRYIFSIMARAIARGEPRVWIERTAGFALAPHAIYYMRAEVKDLLLHTVVGRGAFDYWESGLDLRFGSDMYENFVRYQTRLVRVFDQMAGSYGFKVVEASQSADETFESLKTSITKVLSLRPATPAAHARQLGNGNVVELRPSRRRALRS